MALNWELGGQCVEATVSTVDETWALMSPVHSEACNTGDGVALLHRNVANRWEDVAEGSERDLGACEHLGVPLRVNADLGRRVCHPRKTYVACRSLGSSGTLRDRAAPSRCDTLGATDAFAESANLARLRWRGWGRTTATATGIERGYHLPLSRIPVRIYAYARQTDCNGDYHYTRLRVRSRYGHLIVRQPLDCTS
jgi:hypothetical protein